MKICVAQTRPLKGDVPGNMEQHLLLIDLAISNGAEMIIFPELSLTGYEPTLAEELASSPNDSRFDGFQEISNLKQLNIGVGMPIRSTTGICIGMLLFQPHKARQVYSKKYLHPDEEPFFVAGQSSVGLIGDNKNIALAICYELSVPEHTEGAVKSGAEIYIASVAKSGEGVDKAITRLSEIARTYSMTVLMSNCIGLSDGMECGGKTSILNKKGIVVGQLNDTDEGILLIDTDTSQLIQKSMINLSEPV